MGVACAADLPPPAGDARGGQSERAVESVTETAFSWVDFRGTFDPRTERFELAVLDTEPLPGVPRTEGQPLYCARRVTAGRVNTFGLETRPGSVGFTPTDCGVPAGFPYDTQGVFCATVDLTSYFEDAVPAVYAEIVSVTPDIGHNGYNHEYGTGVDVSTLADGFGLPTDVAGGLWGYGAIAPGETKSVQWLFEYQPEPFVFRGRLLAVVPERRNGVDDNCDGGVDEAPFADGETCADDAECFGGACVDGRCASLTDGCVPGQLDPACAPLTRPPTVAALDYAYQYLPTNHRPVETWPAVQHEHHVLTGHYGAAWDNRTGALVHLGALDDELTMAEALERENAVIDAMDAVTVSYEAGAAGSAIVATGFLGQTTTALPDGDPTHRARVIDGGRFMNRLVIPTVTYAADETLAGEVLFASSPRHVVLTQHVSGTGEARIRLGGALTARHGTTTWLASDRVATRTDESGAGWLFAVYDQPGHGTTLRVEGDELVAEAVADAGAADATISLLIAPLSALDGDLEAFYVDPTGTARVQTTLLTRDGDDVGATTDAVWDPTLGAFRASMGTIAEAGGPTSRRPDYTANPDYHHWHGRHRVELTSFADAPIAIPVAMWGADGMALRVTGGSPMLRDANGEPTGLPIQVSKNWHEGYPNNWYHLYTQPTLQAGATSTLELTMASSMWGDVFAASHAQLSLIGWSTAGGHWDESALGVFGESITYDPDVNLRRAMMDDVRPFLVDAQGEWDWTGNVGGGEFLRYATAAQPYWTRRVARVRSLYRATGPNLTDVTYSGVSSDGRIRVDARTRLVASDDLVRTYLDLSFRFLDDVAYDRLAFFQIAADNYADNLFSTLAWGNRDGAIDVQPVRTSTTRGYASADDRGIPLPGDEPWVFLFDNQKVVPAGTVPESFGNVGFVVRAFEARIGDGVITTPHISLHQTFNGGDAQTSFELSLPLDDGAPWCGAPCGGNPRVVPAGSTVEATVEYVVPPADAYYGPSLWLAGFAPPDGWSSAAMMEHIAREGAVSVTVEEGALLSTYPVEVAASTGASPARLTLTGGLGYTPVSFSGLLRHDGWRLERLEEGVWVALDASSSPGANDWWQANHDALTDTWTLTYSVPAGPPQTLRLVWAPR